MTVPPRTRYAKGGEVHIAHQVLGDGPFDVVFVPGFVSNVDQYWESPRWAPIFERLASFSQMILWDKRGTGLSDPVEQVPTLDERVDDLQPVMDAAGSERAALFGISDGGPMALLFASSRPDRVTTLVLYGATPRFMSSPDWSWGWTVEEYTDMLNEVERDWGHELHDLEQWLHSHHDLEEPG